MDTLSGLGYTNKFSKILYTSKCQMSLDKFNLKYPGDTIDKLCKLEVTVEKDTTFQKYCSKLLTTFT